MYDPSGPMWKLLSEDASERVRKGNYERILDQAQQKALARETSEVE